MKVYDERVEEMMNVMSRPETRSKDNERSVDMMMNTSGDSGRGIRSATLKKGATSPRAAEDLAAARVEAMMAALSTSQLHEGEI